MSGIFIYAILIIALVIAAFTSRRDAKQVKARTDAMQKSLNKYIQTAIKTESNHHVR